MSRSRRATAHRRPPAHRFDRRVSGPVRPRGVPSPRPRAAAATAAPAPAAVRYGRLRAVGDHHLLDSLLRSRAWIWLLGIGLGGIVAMQVSLLGMNAGISRDVVRLTALEHDRSTLEDQVSRLSSGDRIRRAAQQEGLIAPAAGSVSFLAARGAVDARRAADRIVAPSDTARQTVAAGGTTPAAVTPGPTAAAAPVATATPAAPAPAAVAPTATPAPVATAVPPSPVAPTSGAGTQGALTTAPAGGTAGSVPGQG